MIKCGYCGYESTLDEYFVKADIPNQSPQKVCPGCFDKLAAKKKRGITFNYLMALILGIILTVLMPDSKIGWWFLNLFSMWFFLCVSLLLHELGHYFTSLSLGGYVPRVQIGTGPILKCFRTEETVWEFRSYWFSGLTFTGFKEDEYSLVKCFLVYLAGPLVNIFLLILGVITLSSLENYGMLGGVNLPITLIIANILLLLGSLKPIKNRRKHGGESDGRRLYEIITGKYKNTGSVYEQSLYTIRLQNLAEQEQNEEGLREALEARDKFPSVNIFKFYETAFLAEVGQFNESIKKAEKYLNELSVEEDCLDKKVYEILFKICLASAINEDKENNNVRLALEVAEFGFKGMPWNYGILAIYGKALAAAGDKKAGIKILKRALTFEQPKTRALITSATIALIYLDLGQRSKAKTWLEKCEKYKTTNAKLLELKSRFASDQGSI